MSEMSREELLQAEAVGGACGWVAPMTKKDKAYIACLCTVFERYSIAPSKATRLEQDFVVRLAESEFYLRQANTQRLNPLNRRTE